MRISWGYIVGGIVLAGAAVAIYQATSSDDRSPSRPQPVAQAPAGSIAAPKPDKSFGPVELASDDYVLGNREAKVTVIEYASLTCPHCAALNNEVLPRIKKEYVETGKVRYVYRDFPLDQIALQASLLARCTAPDRFFGFVDALFASQSNWAHSTDPVRGLEQVGKLGGVTPEKFEQCRNDEELKNKVLQQRLDADKTFQVNATPTLLIDGDRYSRGLTYEEFKAILDAHLSKRG
jgi:protein-disulfide isomerase